MADDPHHGEERRMAQDELLGYMKGKLESLQFEITEFKEHFHRHAAKEEEDRKAVLSAIADLKKSGSIRHGMIKALKAMGLGFVFIVTFNLGDIATIVKKMFN